MLLQMALFLSFLWLSYIPLYICTTSFFIHSSVDGHLRYFHGSAIADSTATNTGGMYLFKLCLFFLSWIYAPGVGFLDHMATIFRFFKASPYCSSPQWLYQFTVPPTV